LGFTSAGVGTGFADFRGPCLVYKWQVPELLLLLFSLYVTLATAVARVQRATSALQAARPESQSPESIGIRASSLRARDSSIHSPGSIAYHLTSRVKHAVKYNQENKSIIHRHEHDAQVRAPGQAQPGPAALVPDPDRLVRPGPRPTR
jgi:hypothetical protein